MEQPPPYSTEGSKEGYVPPPQYPSTQQPGHQGYPPQNQGYPPQQPGYPPQGQGYVQQPTGFSSHSSNTTVVVQQVSILPKNIIKRDC